MDEKRWIGIKIADGTFFPVLNGKDDKRKRLVLTTVNDNQESVQIDLYEGTGEDFADPVYVGSLVIDNIAEAEKGSPEIELKLGFDSDGLLSASAKDLASGTEESLSVRVEEFEEGTTYDVPEFSLDEDDFSFDSEIDLDGDAGEDDFVLDEEDTEDDFDRDSEDETDMYAGESSSGSAHEYHSRSAGRMSPLLIALFVLLALGILAGITYLVYRSFGDEKVPVLQAANASQGNSTSTASEAVKVESAVKEQPPKAAASVDKPAPSETKQTPSASVGGKENNNDQGVWYRIRWGDTLWGISYSFYKSPTLYAKIAKKNKIKDPDLIFAETKIFIPKE